MLNSTTLEVAIGMALVYLLLSLFCTAINEIIAGYFNTRAKNLERGIRSLFTEGNLSKTLSLTDAIYRHGLVQSLYRSGAGTAQIASDKLEHPPSYIPSRTFATALYDVLFGEIPIAAPVAGVAAAPEVAQANQLIAMLKSLENLPESPARQAMATLVKEAQGDVEMTRQSFEHWFDDGMDRAAGWYKKRTQRSLFLIGLIAAIALNVDTIVVARTFWNSPATRSFAISYADKIANDSALKTRGNSEKKAAYGKAAAPAPGGVEPGTSGAASSTIADATKNLDDLRSINLPIGWKESVLFADWSDSETTWPARFRLWLFASALLGWILTAIAMTLGAPFWFDLLNQFMVVRSTIKPREKSDVEGSKDSQKKT